MISRPNREIIRRVTFLSFMEFKPSKLGLSW